MKIEKTKNKKMKEMIFRKGIAKRSDHKIGEKFAVFQERNNKKII